MELGGCVSIPRGYVRGTWWDRGPGFLGKAMNDYIMLLKGKRTTNPKLAVNCDSSFVEEWRLQR